MPELGPHRSPWLDFPDVVIQTTVHKLRSHPAYDQAKRGVGEAAFEVTRELLKLEKIPIRFDTAVPVMQFDRDKPNVLPLVYAAALAKHFNAYLETGVRQVNVVSHTFADAQTRILGQPIFMGKIQTRSHVLIDDVVTFGSTLAAGFGGTKLALPYIVRDWLLDRFPTQSEALAKELGFSADCFTNREARFLTRLNSEYEMQRLIVAARELTLRQERQQSLERTNQIDPPSQPC